MKCLTQLPPRPEQSSSATFIDCLKIRNKKAPLEFPYFEGTSEIAVKLQAILPHVAIRDRKRGILRFRWYTVNFIVILHHFFSIYLHIYQYFLFLSVVIFCKDTFTIFSNSLSWNNFLINDIGEYRRIAGYKI